MSKAPDAAGEAPAWSEHLARVSSEGHFVVAATRADQHDVESLLTEMLAHSAFSGHTPSAPRISSWVGAVLASPLWLILILKDAKGRSRGLAVCEYIAYEVDIDSRILKCKHFYVRHRRKGSLFAPSKLLLDALLEAACRSPKLRDVFIVSTGAQQFRRLGPCLQRHGFRKIGTQHIGRGGGFPASAAQRGEIQAIHSPHVLDATEVGQIQTLGEAFFKESARFSLGPLSLDFDRLFTSALGSDGKGLAYLAHADGKIVGFIAGREGSPSLTTLRCLHSTFFYVDPDYRAGALPLKLFDAFSATACQRGLAGALLGTSGGISVDRVCRLLELRGYSHWGDVFSVRVDRRERL